MLAYVGGDDEAPRAEGALELPVVGVDADVVVHVADFGEACVAALKVAAQHLVFPLSHTVPTHHLREVLPRLGWSGMRLR